MSLVKEEQSARGSHNIQVGQFQLINTQNHENLDTNLNSSATSSLAGSISQYEKKY